MFNGFWMGFIIGGIVCVVIYEFIEFLIIAATGVKGLEKEIKRKNDIEELKLMRLRSDIQKRNERQEPQLRSDIQERNERKEPRL